MLGVCELYLFRTGDRAGYKVIQMYFCRGMLVRGPGFDAKMQGMVCRITDMDCLMLNTADREKRP